MRGESRFLDQKASIMPVSLRGRKVEDEGVVPLINENDSRHQSPDKMGQSEYQEKKGIKGDELNVAVLLFLYVLQGIPLGLAAAIPLLLTNRHVSYKDQAQFSFAYWPFSIKLLWAPIVDSCFISSFGRRKTWLVPVQYLIGITMLLLSANVDFYLGEHDQSPNIVALTGMFFFLNFLAATQDIAVDGWALTMLQRHNVGYASTCNSVGQTAGYFLGYVFYIGLESYGLVTLSGFLFFWGIVFLCATTLVAIFKHEVTDKTKLTSAEENHPDLGVVETYTLLWKIIKLPLMPFMILVLLTSKMGFSAADSVTSLKLIEQGVPKDKLAMLAVPMIPLQILLPLVISRYTVGSKPMNVYLMAIVPRLILGLIFAGLVYVTPMFMLGNGQFPLYYYGMIVCIYSVHQIFANCMFVSIMAFFARVSDPAVGGTYMTMLNTLTNLGGNWPATLALWAVDSITVKECQGGDREKIAPSNVCDGAVQTDLCEDFGGTCVVLTEGYYIESVACFFLGLLWLLWGWRTIKWLQDANLDEWRVVETKKQKV
ncbi:hypothetical protein TCAL_04103 [Tigriopus californicus]|uniref:Major facilitator superfamily (MFS) profile domain-containing protein n=1 Tax=Tigriopus californicus TaxID=6832 RepID=A0A553NVZ1_TIGCA|nr:hypothetical protein TCAL_04103 [Tigriopus californicus]